MSKCNILSFSGHAEEAQLPYFDLLPSDPTLEEVRRIVCVERRRPSLPNPWNQHEVHITQAPECKGIAVHTCACRYTNMYDVKVPFSASSSILFMNTVFAQYVCSVFAQYVRTCKGICV